MGYNSEAHLVDKCIYVHVRARVCVRALAICVQSLPPAIPSAPCAHVPLASFSTSVDQTQAPADGSAVFRSTAAPARRPRDSGTHSLEVFYLNKIRDQRCSQLQKLNCVRLGLAS